MPSGLTKSPSGAMLLLRPRMAITAAAATARTRAAPLFTRTPRAAVAYGKALPGRALCSAKSLPQAAQLAAELASEPEKLHDTIDALPPAQRRFACLNWAVHELEEEFIKADADGDGVITYAEFRVWATNVLSGKPEPDLPASREQLRILFRTTMLPFIGFGFTDNALMVIMGDAIDGHIGTLLGISTLAAAAMGNAISNGAGMVLHGTVERFAAALGLVDPKLTRTQKRSKEVKNVKMLAGILGVMLGCFLGMSPLLVLRRDVKPRPATDDAATCA